MFNTLLLAVMLGILISLGSALVFLVRDSGKTQRTVVSLSIRVALSVLLLILLAIGFATKYLVPGS
ncbi:MAG TPA: twin transmembrane helix small protein [Gammaproteobacteria bacterium]|nr:twin transmembrane helix small protein [Gammaproteobacteria bacterium]